ncbi:hypothetical protein MTR_2g015725 [Medicago truncatula]|uniref:Uncharacterized protein n=1 Tax=Medicago truncatula TaxID=3880 RepID=A0A072V3H0_MEDTR|nr:hypothetical protein MTR_2g015725 [Medicago truncatula]
MNLNTLQYSTNPLFYATHSGKCLGLFTCNGSYGVRNPLSASIWFESLSTVAADRRNGKAIINSNTNGDTGVRTLIMTSDRTISTFCQLS